jgi:glycosyltransferase involved in cell wall biosynthesis
LLLQELQARGYEFVIVTSHHYMTLPDEEMWQGIPLYRFDFSTALGKGDLATWVRQQKRLAKIVDDFQPELHHVFGIGPSMVACLQILKQKRVPLIASLANVEQNPDTGLAREAVIAKTLLASTWITTVSQAILEQTVHYLPETKARISVLYNGHPRPAIEPLPLASPPRLLLIGRLIRQKGGELAIAAFEKIYQRYPDARLIIAGDGPDREPWQQLASCMGERVEFIGWTDPEEVYALMNRMTMVLIPSRWEGLPLVAIETAYMARPTVATRIPGMAEIVVDGETGLLVEPGDAEGMAKAIAFLLDHPEQATAMGLVARQRALAYFTQQRCADEHEALYTRIVKMTS